MPAGVTCTSSTTKQAQNGDVVPLARALAGGWGMVSPAGPWATAPVARASVHTADMVAVMVRALNSPQRQSLVVQRLQYRRGVAWIPTTRFAAYHAASDAVVGKGGLAAASFMSGENYGYTTGLAPSGALSAGLGQNATVSLLTDIFWLPCLAAGHTRPAGAARQPCRTSLAWARTGTRACLPPAEAPLTEVPALPGRGPAPLPEMPAWTDGPRRTLETGHERWIRMPRLKEVCLPCWRRRGRTVIKRLLNPWSLMGPAPERARPYLRLVRGSLFARWGGHLRGRLCKATGCASAGL